jgi:uridine kinase
MSKTFKIYGVLFLVIAILLGILELNKKEVIDWRKNFDMNQKSPFGLFVFNKEINSLLNNEVTKSDISPYSYYTKNTKVEPQNILLINGSVCKYI